MQNGASLLYILRTPSLNELLRSCLQALPLVSFIVTLFVFFCTLILSLQLNIIGDKHHIGAKIGSRRLIYHRWCFLMILDLVLLVPQLVTPQRLQHPNTLPCALLHRSRRDCSASDQKWGFQLMFFFSFFCLC